MEGKSNIESLDSLVGKQLGPYILEEKIGEGGFLTVFRGRHPDVKRKVAVKIVDPIEKGRLLREASVLSEVGNHPNIVHLLDSDLRDSNPTPYEVVEFCESSVQGEIAEKKKIDWRTAVQYTIEIAGALDYTHGKGIVHGDIKPSNILIQEGRAKLSDFDTKDINPEILANSLLLSGQRDALGIYGLQKFRTATALYLTPEHTNSDAKLIPQSDFHQLGQVLHEMITGKKFIHRTKSAAENGAPKWIDDVISRATANDPAERYQSGAEMCRDIQEGLDGKLNGDLFGKRFKEGLAKTLAGIGKGILTGAKYGALGITAPIWGPIGLVNYLDDNTSGDGAAIAAFFGALFYYGAGIPMAINYGIENPTEERTKVVAKAEFDKADKDLHVAYIRNGNLRLVPVGNLLDEDPKTYEFSIPQKDINSIDFVDNTFYYSAEEKTRNDKGEDIKFPQIYKAEVNSGSTIPIFNSNERNYSLLDGKELDEVHVLEDEGKRRVVFKVENRWYEVKEGDVEEINSVTLPLRGPSGRLPNSNIEFDGSNGFGFSNVQFNREGHWWGDVELFERDAEKNRPTIVRYTH